MRALGTIALTLVYVLVANLIAPWLESTPTDVIALFALSTAISNMIGKEEGK